MVIALISIIQVYSEDYYWVIGQGNWSDINSWRTSTGAIPNEVPDEFDNVIFNEDSSRVRIGHGPQNFAIIRHFALNLLKHDPSKGSLNQKRLRAALDDSFRSQLLSHILMR